MKIRTKEKEFDAFKVTKSIILDANLNHYEGLPSWIKEALIKGELIVNIPPAGIASAPSIAMGYNHHAYDGDWVVKLDREGDYEFVVMDENQINSIFEILK